MPLFSRRETVILLSATSVTLLLTTCASYRLFYPRTLTIAMSWGDGKYGQAFYGAEVFTTPGAEPLDVHARIRIGQGTDVIYSHDCGKLGTVADHAEAVRKFGTIRWAPEGVYIGEGKPTDYFLPRERIESHR